MAYEMVMPYHLHMPSYFLGTFTEYPLYIPPYRGSGWVNVKTGQRKFLVGKF